MEDFKLIESQSSLVLDLPPSCIQFCPKHDGYFVVGTYNLQKNESQSTDDGRVEEDEQPAETKTPQSRNGTLLVYKLEGTEPILVQTVQQPSAILDLRFHQAAEKQDILAVVSSTGSLAVFRLDPQESPASPLKHLATSKCNDLEEYVLFLQCNWHPVHQDLIGVATSGGEARLLRLDDKYQITEPAIELGVANTLEAWSIAFSPATPSSNKEMSQVSVYCGGDDSTLRYATCNWDAMDLDSPHEAPYAPITIKNIHTAGVTAILPLDLLVKGQGRVVITGSYDDHIRVLVMHDLHETYGLRRVEVALEENLGGGVWRLDHLYTRTNGSNLTIRVLASCMHAGARVLDIFSTDNGETWSCRVLSRFEEHKSMNYGSALVTPWTESKRMKFVSTSFYDKLMCVWEFVEE